MTPEEKKRREEEERAKFVTPTMVPPPPRPQEPQIQQQPQNPSVPKMFGDMMKAKIMEKAVGAAMGFIPFMKNGGNVVGLARGDEVPHTDDDKDPVTRLYEKPGPRLPAPRPQAIGPLAQALPPGLTSTDMQILQFYGVDPFKASIEDAEHYGNLYEYQYGGMELHPLADPGGYNKGGNVPYFQIGGNSGKYPGGLSPAGMIRQFMRLKELDDAVKSKGRGESPIPNPKMPALGAPGPRMVRAQEGQKIPKSFVMPEFKPKQQSNKDESYFQRFERTGQLGTGIPNVYVTPQRQGAMVSYERNDVLPFTSIWNMMFNKSMKEKK